MYLPGSLWNIQLQMLEAKGSVYFVQPHLQAVTVIAGPGPASPEGCLLGLCVNTFSRNSFFKLKYQTHVHVTAQSQISESRGPSTVGVGSGRAV